jgi:flavin-dependent dehydrogenase
MTEPDASPLVAAAAPANRRNGDDYDVVVIGGGPAGAAAALALADRGRSVAIIHRPGRQEAHVGETVPPAIMRQLARLGLWEVFMADGHTPAPGTMVSWGSATPYENDFIFDPYGSGWHLDRARFETMLVDAAIASGADLYESRRFDCCHSNTEGWLLRSRGSPLWTVRAMWAIDASGRAAYLARRQGIGRDRCDRLVGLARFYTAVTTTDTRTFIESCEIGWWYAAALPDSRAVAVLFTDADLLPCGRLKLEQCWNEFLAKTDLVGGHISAGTAASPLYTAAACSGLLSSCAGENWLGIGDASQSWDPLSGQGITNALASAVQAAEVITSKNQDRRSMLEGYASRAQRQYHDYLVMRSVHYRRETRWPQNTFWRRRAE